MGDLPRPTLVQRLKARRPECERYAGIDCDFSLDYMGATEFETGSAFRAQRTMAELLNSLTIIEIENCSHHKKCWYLGTEAQLQEAQTFFEQAINGNTRYLQESSYIDHTYGTASWDASRPMAGGHTPSTHPRQCSTRGRSSSPRTSPRSSSRTSSASAPNSSPKGRSVSQPDFRLPCRRCGELSDYVYCEKCAKDAKCPHGNDLGNCTQCDVEGDLAYDSAREGR
tara:strand:- start:4345 stop:5022 length:678 start_codon:yes stop_codon:yes gene_type:complete